MVPRNWQPAALPAFEMRRRSATLEADPKAREMTNFSGSHMHEARLKEAAGMRQVPLESMDAVDKMVKVLREQEIYEDHEVIRKPPNDITCRLQWRKEMDLHLGRLVQGTKLILENNIMKADDVARLRCNHLDKTYSWFEDHGRKEVRKEKPAPHFISFDVDAAAMPGSMRVVKHLLHKPAPSLVTTTLKQDGTSRPASRTASSSQGAQSKRKKVQIVAEQPEISETSETSWRRSDSTVSRKSSPNKSRTLRCLSQSWRSTYR